MNLTIEQRAKEIADFLGKDYRFCLDRLKQGFGPLHNAVTADWNAANPKTDDEILEWYRKTDSYIFELSAYHLDSSGFNYSGMVGGVVAALKSKGCEDVLCLGDGIGDLTLAVRQSGMDGHYHDLCGSRTAAFAESRLRHYDGMCEPVVETGSFAPPEFEGPCFDAVVSLDFLEHVKGVSLWVDAIYRALKPGGYFVAQNAFNIGSGPEGSIPMHLRENDIYEKEWDPTLFRIGFVQESSNWYRKPL